VTDPEEAPVSGHDGPIGFSDLDRLDFAKGDGLIPAVIQHAGTAAVLMIGYMNREALEATLTRGRVVFFSRSKGRLWEKGETSGHALAVAEIHADCDRDALLVTVWPQGPVCHLGNANCFGSEPNTDTQELAFLGELEHVIGERMAARLPGSYTARLVASGMKRIAQKVSEEGLEVALAAAAGTDGEVVAEASDLFYHVLVLLKARGLNLKRVVAELHARHVAQGVPEGSR
jgi:phosphoribosyl-ATP pyrophosphohydrolase/phosphoribosyl-AMP cyclohydrolase